MALRRRAAHRFKDIGVAFLQGDDIILPQDKTDLLRGHGFVVIFEGESFHHDKKTAFQVFHFGTLGRIEDVFQKKMMNAIALSKGFDEIRPVKTADMNPGGGGQIPVRKAVLDGCGLLFLKVFFVVVAHRQNDRIGLLLADKNQGTGWKTQFF